MSLMQLFLIRRCLALTMRLPYLFPAANFHWLVAAHARSCEQQRAALASTPACRSPAGTPRSPREPHAATPALAATHFPCALFAAVQACRVAPARVLPATHLAARARPPDTPITTLPAMPLGI